MLTVNIEKASETNAYTRRCLLADEGQAIAHLEMTIDESYCEINKSEGDDAFWKTDGLVKTAVNYLASKGIQRVGFSSSQASLEAYFSKQKITVERSEETRSFSVEEFTENVGCQGGAC